jgi:tetratricopeptide (TPR) repeat protein
MKLDALKEKARRHEQREEWFKALETYLGAVESQSDEDEPDITLYNRIGDLQVRVGDVEGAITSYQEAIDLYIAAGLPNNAIALCRKIVRTSPRSPEPYIRMGRVRAGQGLFVDARQNFLTYAELMEAAGETDEALRALEEFVQVAEDDVETREFLAAQLVSREREEDAARYLEQAYRILVRSGEASRADDVLENLRKLVPDGPLPEIDSPVALEDDRASDTGAAILEGFESTALGGELPFIEDVPKSPPDSSDDHVPDPSAGESGEEEVEKLPGESPGELPEVGRSLEGFETSDLAGSGPESADFAAGEATAGDEFDEEPPEDDLPYLDLGREPEASGEDRDEVTAPRLDGELHDPATDASMDDDRPPAPGPSHLDELHAQIRDEPGRIDLRQKLVERAMDADDRPLLVEAFLGLAHALIEAGQGRRARQVAERVLHLDPGNSGAKDILASPESGPEILPPPSRAGRRPAGGPVGPSGGRQARDGYVDFRSLVVDQRDEGTTRWTVKAEAPSSDEEADFRRLLAQFKAKVAENIATEDSKAHYDLGMAYREMGLIEEAMGEFQQALRAEPGSLATVEMLGRCFLENGDPQVAIHTLERGLRLPGGVEDDYLGIYYFLGNAHESVGNIGEAREFYEKVFSLDINFRDVTDRLKALR